MDVIGGSENAFKQSIHCTRAPKDRANAASKRKVIPAWSDLVVPKKEEAKCHYQFWLSANKPHTDDLFNNMCRSRNQFKYTKRLFNNAEKLIKRDEFVDACVSGDKNLKKKFALLGILMCTEDDIVLLRMLGTDFHHVPDTGDGGLAFWYKGKATVPELTNLEAVATLPEGLELGIQICRESSLTTKHCSLQ